MARKQASADEQAGTTEEFHVWYNAPDGVRRSLNALDDKGLQQVIGDVHADEARRQLLAQTVGLSVDPIDPGFDIFKVTTTIEKVEYQDTQPS